MFPLLTIYFSDVNRHFSNIHLTCKKAISKWKSLVSYHSEQSKGFQKLNLCIQNLHFVQNDITH